MAASIALLIMTVRFLPSSRNPGGADAPTAAVATGEDDARLGLSLRGESATQLLAVASPASDPNVRIYFLYPRLDAVATRDEPETVTP